MKMKATVVWNLFKQCTTSNYGLMFPDDCTMDATNYCTNRFSTEPPALVKGLASELNKEREALVSMFSKVNSNAYFQTLAQEAKQGSDSDSEEFVVVEAGDIDMG